MVDFDPLEFFKAELCAPNSAQRAHAVKQIASIAIVLGSQRTIHCLIPLINEAIRSPNMCAEDDEVLRALGVYLENLIPLVEGEYQILVPPLEFLATQDETVIRDAAVKSLSRIANINSFIAQQHCIPVLNRLASGEWFTSRVSACGLFAGCYPNASNAQKNEMRHTFCSLYHDEAPMVRRAAAHNFRDFIAVVEKLDIISDLLPLHEELVSEETMDVVRESAVAANLVLAQIFDQEETKKHLIPTILKSCDDRSWRCRLAVVNNFDSFCSALGSELTSTFLLQPFVQLLKDSEQDVRVAAVCVIEKCLGVLSVDQIENFIVPQCVSLGNDASQIVRSSLAQVLGALCFKIGKEPTEKMILNLALDLLKDDFHNVRLNMVKHVGIMCDVLGVDVMANSLLIAIQSLIMDNQWRIRLSVVQQIPKLAKQFGPELFQAKLERLFLLPLRDSVHSVRENVIFNMKLVSETFGSQWTLEYLLPKLVDQYTEAQTQGYSNRLTTIQAIPQLTSVMTFDEVVEHVIPLLIQATKDPVANVRFAALECLYAVMAGDLSCENFYNSVVGKQLISPAIADLKQDTDHDVKYWADKVMRFVNEP